jgi:hypothetical protein
MRESVHSVPCGLALRLVRPHIGGATEFIYLVNKGTRRRRCFANVREKSPTPLGRP